MEASALMDAHVQLKRIYTALNEALDLTRQLADAVDRDDQVATQMLIAMRQEPTDKLAGAHQVLAQQRQTQVTQVIQRYIHDNYMYDLSMQDLAQMMNYSEAYFSRLFKQCFGRNFTSYIAEYRVNEARQLLKQSNVNIKEIGRAVGYPDSNYFTKVFRRITGQSPTEYRLSIFRKQDFSVSISDK